jgi:hypothetical protein
VAEIVFDDDGVLLALIFDVCSEERHRASAQATEHDVERGVAITDHVRPERRLLTLEVVVSDTPFRAGGDVSGVVEAVEVPVSPAAVQRGPKRTGDRFERGALEQSQGSQYLAVFQADGEMTRVVDKWARIIDARDRALLATITTKIETYTNMVLVEAQTTRTAADATWLRAELTFAEVRQVSLELVNDPVPARVRDRREVNRGAQATQPATPRLRSDAVQILDALGSLRGGS